MRHQFFFFSCLGYLAGIALASYTHIEIAYILFGLAAAMLCLRLSSKFGTLLFAGCIGVLWFTAYGFITAGNIAKWTGEKGITIQGVVQEDPNIYTDSQNFYIQVESVSVHSIKTPATGVLFITTPAFPRVEKNTRIAVMGSIELPTGTLASSLFRKNASGVMKFPIIQRMGFKQTPWLVQLIDSWRNAMNSVVERTFPEPAGSFLLGVLLGGKRALPDAVVDAFNRTGTAHIIAVSGYNVTILFAALAGIFGKLFSRKTTFWTSVMSLVIYVGMCGASASVIRAALMGVVARYGKNHGRPAYAPNLLFGAATLMCVMYPKALAYDTGFQLSFLATAGIVFSAEWLEKQLLFLPKVFGLHETAAVTLAAQLLTVPLIAVVFHQVSLISLIVNLLALPLIPSIMAIGAATLLMNIIIPFLSHITIIVPLMLIRLELGIVQMAARVPFASMQTTVLSFPLMGTYLLCSSFIIFRAKLWRKKLSVFAS